MCKCVVVAGDPPMVVESPSRTSSETYAQNTMLTDMPRSLLLFLQDCALSSLKHEFGVALYVLDGVVWHARGLLSNHTDALAAQNFHPLANSRVSVICRSRLNCELSSRHVDCDESNGCCPRLLDGGSPGHHLVLFLSRTVRSMHSGL